MSAATGSCSAKAAIEPLAGLGRQCGSYPPGDRLHKNSYTRRPPGIELHVAALGVEQSPERLVSKCYDSPVVAGSAQSALLSRVVIARKSLLFHWPVTGAMSNSHSLPGAAGRRSSKGVI